MNSAHLNLHAQSPRELISLLSALDITVPLQTEGRTTAHRERYMMARLLSTLSGSPLLRFPLRVGHRDGPDFAVQFGEQKVGVECVEAVPEEWAQILAIRDKDFPEAMIFLPMFPSQGKAFTMKQRLDIARGERTGPPWVGKMAHRQWADAMVQVVSQKTQKLRSGKYNEFSESWLLIQDEWPLPIHNQEEYEEAATLCAEKLAELLRPPAFTHLFVGNSRWLIHLAPKPIEVLAMRDLW